MSPRNVGIGDVPKRSKIRGRQGIATSMQETVVIRLEGGQRAWGEGARDRPSSIRVFDAHMLIRT